MTDAALFGLELRRARERRGLSLDQLAEATKVSGALFAGLEHGNLSRWPGGIFRRAFVRAYAQVVGLDAEETLAQFLRIHPDTEGTGAVAAAPATAPTVDAEVSTPRLVLDETAAAPRFAGAWLTARRAGAALLDLVLAGVPAVAVSLAFGWSWFFPVAALIGVVGHTLSIAIVGVTPGAWVLLPRSPVARRLAAADAQAPRRAEAEPAAGPHRRRQPRHASSSARPVPARAHRIQH